MAAWSDIFEKRLSAVLSENREPWEHTELELTPPPTVAKDVQPPLGDPTASFFDSIRRNSHSNKSSETNLLRPLRPTAQANATNGPVLRHVARPAIRGLQESYSDRAKDLRDEATQRLKNAQSSFEEKLSRRAEAEKAFLASVDRQHALFNKPPTEWAVTIQTRPNGAQTAPTEKNELIVDRMAQMMAAVAALETDLKHIWKEWDRANNAVTAMLEVISKGPDSSDATFRKIISDAERELEAAASEALKEMRDNEKTFRKLILAEECKLAQSMLARQSKYD